MHNPTEQTGFEIVAREDFSDVTFLLEIRHPMLAKAARPGQFVIVMANENGERIPLTIADFDRDKGTITLVIQAVGKTTREMQRDCRGSDSTPPIASAATGRGDGSIGPHTLPRELCDGHCSCLFLTRFRR